MPNQVMVGKPAGRRKAFGQRVRACANCEARKARTGHAVALCQLDLLRCVDHCREELVLVGEVGAQPLKVRVQRPAVPAPRREEDDERILASNGRLKVARIQGGDAAAFTQLTQLLLSGSGAEQEGRRQGDEHARRAHCLWRCEGEGSGSGRVIKQNRSGM